MVIDASVAAKWFLDEQGSRTALDLARSEEILTSPDLVLYEVFSSVSAAVRRARAAPAVLESLARQLPRAFSELVPTQALFEEAARLSLDSGHSVYDCVYLALARRSGCTLVTADERQFALAGQARIDARLL